MNRFFAPHSSWQDEGLAFVRIITGLFMLYHGWELLDAAKMKDYSTWLTDLRFPAPQWMAYTGKFTELAAGLLLLSGWLTRLAAAALAVTMAVICFGMGKGRIFMEDQHPFLFVVIAILFLSTGAGKYSLDHLLYTKQAKKRAAISSATHK